MAKQYDFLLFISPLLLFTNMSTTNLTYLIANMEPRLNAGAYIFATMPHTAAIPRASTICEFKEKEGTTVIIEKAAADRLGLDYSFVAAWITLHVHSDLAAVGLTAAFSSALAQNDISCNVVAGFYHDHLFVDTKDGEKALAILQEMAGEAATS